MLQQDFRKHRLGPAPMGLGLSGFQDDTPSACFTDIPAEDLKEAQLYGDLMGKKARELRALDAPRSSRRDPDPDRRSQVSR